MRYKFAVLLFAFFSFFVTAATADPKPTEANKVNVSATVDVGDNAKELLQHGGTAVAKIVEQLATTLGTTTEKIFPYYVKQAHLRGLVQTVVWAGFEVLFLFALIIAAAVGGYFHEHKGGDSNETGACFIAGFIVFVIFGIGIVVGAFNLTDWITLIINPEYNAVSTLMKEAAQFKRR